MAPAQIVALYLRLSKKDDRSTSIEKQRGNARRVAAERFPGRPVKEYLDNNVSASKGRARAALDELLADLAAGRVVAVVIDTVDRLTRERGSKALWEVAEACEKAGADFLGASQELDLVSAGGELTVGVLASAARFEARRTSERVRATNALRASRGLRALGGPPVWGLVREGERFVPHAERGPLLLAAVDRVIAGDLSIRGIAEEFTRCGIPAPRGGDTWNHRAVSKILRSPALAGMTVADGDVLRGLDGLPVVTEGALLDVDRWLLLQATLDERAGSRSPVRPRRERPLLHGLARDDEGHPMYRHEVAGRPTRYTCRATGCPTKTSIGLDALDAHVLAAFLDVMGATPETRAEVVVPGRDVSRLKAIRAEIVRTTTQLGSARDVETITELAGRLGALRGAETEAESGAAHGDVHGFVATGRTLGEALEDAPSVAERRELLAAHIEFVRVRPGRRGPQPVGDRVEVVWLGD